MISVEKCEHYIRHWLPQRLTQEELAMLEKVGVPVAISVQDGGMQSEWVVQARGGELRSLAPETPVGARFRMSSETFLGMIEGRISPQRAFFTGRMRIEGDKFMALKVGSLLSSIFERIPYLDRAEHVRPVDCTSPALTPHQKQIVELHLDRGNGSPFWIRKASATGVVARDVETFEDLEVFGLMNRDEMLRTPMRDFIPKAIVAQAGWITGETGGTTGPALTAAWSREDFRRAFVEPLPRELARRGITGLQQWLYVGPTGPHIIGKAADALAQETTGWDALKIDFDPRWHRRLVPGSLAVRRHLDHLVEQAAHLLRREHVDALFITPTVLRMLLESRERARLEPLRVVHLGGQSIEPEEYSWLREQLPGHCALINGFGNSLFGCLVETDESRPLYYEATSERLVARVTSERDPFAAVADGEWGRVLLHRFDSSMLIVNHLERDWAQREGEGLRCPRPSLAPAAAGEKGIY